MAVVAVWGCCLGLLMAVVVCGCYCQVLLLLPPKSVVVVVVVVIVVHGLVMFPILPGS